MKLFSLFNKKSENPIKRKVFIIKGFSKTEREEVIDKQFCEWYHQFFSSNAGGAYNQNEIEFLNQPEYKQLNKKILRERLDFGIIVYIGHGANQNDNQLFQLSKDEIIKAGQFLFESKKQIIILESCRVLVSSVPTVDLEDKIPAFEKGGIFRDRLNREQSREIYDSHIKRCENGIIICYACKLGTSAFNYFFSKAFLQNAMDWHLDSSRHCAILPIDELMRLTCPDTIMMAKEQIDEIQVPHDENPMNFPIAISKY